VYKPGKLHRKLSVDGSPIFEAVAGSLTFGDDAITSINISRGNADASPDVSPSTVDLAVVGAQSVDRNAVLSVRLTDAAASRFAFGGIAANEIADRFNGRRGGLNVEDVAWKAGKVEKFYTQISGASWTSLLRNAARTTSPEAGANVASALVWAWDHPDLSGKQPLAWAPLDTFDTTYAKEWGLTFSDISTKFGTDMGTLFQHRRDGSVRILSIGYRRQMLFDRLETEWPVTRSQAISPATWSTQIESASVQYHMIRRLPSGALYEQDWPTPVGSTIVLLKREDIDVSQVLPTGIYETYRLLANSLNHQSNSSRLEIEAIKFDMIHLLSSSKIVDRTIAAQLLKLEAGDPLFLSGDWPEAVRGPYYANQINESIGPNSWEISIDVFHAKDVVGMFDNETPEIPGKVWDSLVSEWNVTPGSWNSYT